MRTKITKLDRRFTGYAHFTYMAVPLWHPDVTFVDRVDTIRQMRQWCWETFGPSCEYDEYSILVGNDREVNERWSWLPAIEHRPARILIKNEADRNWFALRWS